MYFDAMYLCNGTANRKCTRFCCRVDASTCNGNPILCQQYLREFFFLAKTSSFIFDLHKIPLSWKNAQMNVQEWKWVFFRHHFKVKQEIRNISKWNNVHEKHVDPDVSFRNLSIFSNCIRNIKYLYNTN